MAAKLKMSDFRQYDSIDQLIRFLKQTPCGSSSGDTSDAEWYGTASYEEAEAKITKGDDELAKMMRGSEKLDVNLPVQGTRRKICTAVAGFAPHVPNALAGVPNNMLWCKEEKVPKKVLTVIYGSNMLCDVSVEQMAKVSARVLSCIMSLERKGYRVGLYIANCARRSSYKTGFVVKLKDAGQHIDLVKLAFPMMSASFNRRFGFKFREMCGWSHHSMGSSQYGYDLRRWLDDHHVDYDVAFGYHDAARIQTVEELEELFLKNVKKLNK